MIFGLYIFISMSMFVYNKPVPQSTYAGSLFDLVQMSLETNKTWLQCEFNRWGLSKFHRLFSPSFCLIPSTGLSRHITDQDESQSTPALLTRICSTLSNSVLSLGIIPESRCVETGARLSVSLEGPDMYSSTAATGKSPLAASSSNSSSLDMNLDELRAVNRYAESTKSLSFLPQVSEKGCF